jgi:hypothetical protein
VLFAVIVGISIVFLVAWAGVAAGLLFSCPGVFVIWILAGVEGEENLVRMISW